MGLHAISAEALKTIAVLDPMPIATLLDRRLWTQCHAALQQVFWPLVDRFYEALPSSVEFWRSGGYQQLVFDHRIGNFGSVGGRYLYSKLGIVLPDEEFLQRAEAKIPRLGRMMGDTYDSDGADFLRQSVLTYAEYELHAPQLATSLRGEGCHENGKTAGNRWLTPVTPPFCPYADRGTCSEFRMLSGFCDAIARADPSAFSGEADGRRRFGGFVKALVSGPCCVSCVGAFAQFRLLFPGVVVSVAAGKMPSLLV